MSDNCLHMYSLSFLPVISIIFITSSVTIQCNTIASKYLSILTSDDCLHMYPLSFLSVISFIFITSSVTIQFNTIVGKY